MRSAAHADDATLAKLVRAAQRGDTKSFEKLYQRHYQEVYVVARATLKDPHEAEDILQQTFVTAWKKLGSLQQPGAFPAWLTRIAINACYSLLRSKNIPLPVDANEEVAEQEDPDEDTMPAVYAERADLRARLSRVIDSLSDLQRQAVAMYYFEGLKVEEIADATESSANTVKVRLHAARKAIKERIIAEEKKSGERFWGVSGVPLLALPAALAPQFSAMGADAGSSASLFERLRADLGGAGASGADASGADTGGADTGAVGGADAGAGGADVAADAGAAGADVAAGIDGVASFDSLAGTASELTSVGGLVGTGAVVTLETAQEELTTLRQKLVQLEEDDASLAELQAHIDNHASEIVQVVGSWRSVFDDLGGALVTSQISDSYAELMDEALSGEDYRLMSAHIDDFCVRVQTCRQQVQADIVDCRERLRFVQTRLHRLEGALGANGWESF